ncbi:hypothetical protein [Enterovibrio paralichthyis]|uniref:hypothetical protein n=1 Tax=Enterovibrio paralichthyis TaxID=2853805 RepID=UPI001C474511|nr:hypothetical protein [Enterovibrio paralichthyis]MBV7300289.1 hypothetical protein [Enterovibrio paralichthyis]
MLKTKRHQEEMKRLERRKLELEIEKLEEEIIAIKMRRRLLAIGTFFTGIGLFAGLLKR